MINAEQEQEKFSKINGLNEDQKALEDIISFDADSLET